jgi:hypothetical protein
VELSKIRKTCGASIVKQDLQAGFGLAAFFTANSL